MIMHSLSTNLLIAESSLTNQTCMIGIAAVKHTCNRCEREGEELRFYPVVNICLRNCMFHNTLPTIMRRFIVLNLENSGDSMMRLLDVEQVLLVCLIIVFGEAFPPNTLPLT